MRPSSSRSVRPRPLVSDVLRRRRDVDSGEDCIDPPLRDERSIPQMQADALADVARHALGCDRGLTPLTSTTVVVRMDLETLVTGLGHARIDGIDQPISAASDRRMAADAELIPAVFEGDSLPLDLGRAARLFTRAQRLALGERDGGCASWISNGFAARIGDICAADPTVCSTDSIGRPTAWADHIR